ncbi:tetratricopeptide repeat protein [Desulfovibrio psychrotolerans]|uniref:Tetratricopeptide repeat protein n=1 Tax=Desulfovibrio psychrotolerans TaxID=415242 RepID=A0A7J0BRP5_9BACT|nr:tetratricopeptide repeat protein [Desulfovibrio psychrotolerans]GFM35852.1 hypothetical protein DSM19430T_05360 [Desulfovibrio psychrotolerans]
MAYGEYELMYPVRGVFSTDKEMKIGFGATRRTVMQNVLVYVEQEPDGAPEPLPVTEEAESGPAETGGSGNEPGSSELSDLPELPDLPDLPDLPNFMDMPGPKDASAEQGRKKTIRLWGQTINDQDVPSGERFRISMEELLNAYLPDPAAYQLRVLPAMRRLNGNIARGERHRQNGELYSAEFEFQNALQVDETNVRATFGLGLVYLDRREAEKAGRVFERLVELEAAFQAPHKHMFNEFGIKLRKNGMYTQALRFYARAVQLASHDDHLMYNIARSLHESGDSEAAVKYMHKALDLNPKLEAAQKLLKFLKKKLTPEN